MKKVIYTIGHSTRLIDEFLNILLLNKIDVLVDVRSIPGSNRNSAYNKENLIESLALKNIKYFHIKELGGLRNKNKDISSNINNYWQNKSFRNYADYAFISNDFVSGLEKLKEIANNTSCAIMCAEILYWKCHRRIITDYLLISNLKVLHIFDAKTIKEATLNEAASLTENGRIRYSK